MKEEEKVVADAPQAKPENKPTANVITDNLRSAADQSNLAKSKISIMPCA